MDIGNNRPKNKGLPDDRYPMVKEDDTCLHWESSGAESLAPMRECWYCRFSDFRKDMNEHQTFSKCRYSANGNYKEGEARKIILEFYTKYFEEI